MRVRRRPLWIFRLIFPLVYAQLGAGLLVVYVVAVVLGAGHGSPPAWVDAIARAITMPWELWGFGFPGFIFNLCITAGLGYLLDRGIERLFRPR